MSLSTRLKALEAAQGQASIAIVGAGYVAGGVLHTLLQTPAMAPTVVVARSADKALAVVEKLGINRADILVSSDPVAISAAIKAGQFVITDDHQVLASIPVDIVIEATGALEYGTRVILAALRAGKHVVSYNAEVDSLLAFRFHREADEHKVIYTIADGDQPGALLRLSEQVEAMGFDITALINCKRHLNLHQNPSSGADYSARDATSNRMTTSFGDGTKMQIEQAVVANATGMAPSIRGMEGIKTTLETITEDVKGLWPEESDVQRHIPASEHVNGVVDYTLGGDFGAGVGVVARHPHAQHHCKALSLYKMGEGPDYFFFRPYHLVHLELPLTIADLLLHGEALARVDTPHVANVVAMAKKDLGAGEVLDGIGGYCAYGLIESLDKAADLLPIALSGYATTIGAVAQDQPIRLDAVTLDESKVVVQEWLALMKLWNTAA